MIKVAIVDDNRKDADILVQYLKKFGEQNEHCEIKVDYFDNGLQSRFGYCIYGYRNAENGRAERSAQIEGGRPERVPYIRYRYGQIRDIRLRGRRARFSG